MLDNRLGVGFHVALLPANSPLREASASMSEINLYCKLAHAEFEKLKKSIIAVRRGETHCRQIRNMSNTTAMKCTLLPDNIIESL